MADTPYSRLTATRSAPLPKAAPPPKPKPPVVIPRKQIATQALKAFEQAVRAFNMRQFSEARSLFLDLLDRYQQEVEIASRSQTYLQVCNSKLSSNQLSPRDADEFYDRGVVALNIGDFVQAKMLFEKALKLRPDDAYILYSLAAAHAQGGAAEEALSCLEQAVIKQPRLRHRALNDNDFGPLKEDRRFRELLGAESPFDKLEARRDVS